MATAQRHLPIAADAALAEKIKQLLQDQAAVEYPAIALGWLLDQTSSNGLGGSGVGVGFGLPLVGFRAKAS